MLIIINKPILHLQPLTDEGADDGAAVDVTCDMQTLELDPEIPTTDVTTWCGTVSVPGDLEVSATFGFAIDTETDGRWSALVGRMVRAEVWDRTDSTKHRTFTTQVGLNPSLYGPDEPGEPRAFDVDFPVLSDVAWVDGAPSS